MTANFDRHLGSIYSPTQLLARSDLSKPITREDKFGMNDPTVTELIYKLVPEELVSFEHLPKQIWRLPHCEVSVERTSEDDIARIAMLQHFPTEVAAREAVEPYLRSWEIWSGLGERHARRLFRFEFARVSIVDLRPASSELSAKLTGITVVKATAVVSEVYPSLSPPPHDFFASRKVEIIWDRWEGYKNGNEPLASVAYYCLTVYESWLINDEARLGRTISKRKARNAAAARFGIDVTVLDTLGELSSEFGDDHERRKAHAEKHTTLRAFRPVEIEWMERVIPEMIRRAGQYAADPQAKFVVLDLRSFPTL